VLMQIYINTRAIKCLIDLWGICRSAAAVGINVV
jgi:hypothetical protein